MTSWEEAERLLDNEASYSVEDVKAMLSTTEKGNVCQGIDNCMIALMHDPVLVGAICHNDLTDKMDITRNLGWGKPPNGGIRDVDVDQIDWYLERTYGLKNYKAIGKALNIIASQNHFHPIKDYLEKLEWDGVSRIGELLPKYLGVEKSDYETEIMTLLMQAAIHRIYNPGCKYEIMVCLIGGQGAGKSTLFRLLAIKDEWFSDDLRRLDDDNVYRKLQGHWIIEMPEMLATVNAKTVEEIKSFLSKQKDNYKIPYEVHPEDESLIEEFLRNGYAETSERILKVMRAEAEKYTQKIFGKLSEYEYDPELVKLHIIGGGGCLIRNFGKYDTSSVEIISDICATAKGYEDLYISKWKRDRRKGA